MYMAPQKPEILSSSNINDSKQGDLFDRSNYSERV